VISESRHRHITVTIAVMLMTFPNVRQIELACWHLQELRRWWPALRREHVCEFDRWAASALTQPIRLEDSTSWREWRVGLD